MSNRIRKQERHNLKRLRAIVKTSRRNNGINRSDISDLRDAFESLMESDNHRVLEKAIALRNAINLSQGV